MIPNDIIFIWCSPGDQKKKIPQDIFDKWYRLNPSFNIKIFKDKEINKFFDDYYDSTYLKFFNEISEGKFKADFFRYCYLYKKGGYYIDIDTEPLLPIKDVLNKNCDFFTVVSLTNGHIAQGLLFSIPQNIIIKECIDSMMNYGSNFNVNGMSEYYYPTKTLYRILNKNLECSIKPGFFYFNNMNIQLGEEVLSDKLFFKKIYRIGRRESVKINSKIFCYQRYLNYRNDSFESFYSFKELIFVFFIFFCFILTLFIIIF